MDEQLICIGRSMWEFRVEEALESEEFQDLPQFWQTEITQHLYRLNPESPDFYRRFREACRLAAYS